MIVVLSPAKKLNEKHEALKGGCKPMFVEQASQLIKKLKSFSPKKIKDLMNLSDALAQTNYQRYQEWQMDHTANKALSAGLLFDGEVYSGLEASTFSVKEMDYAQDHLRILSGLYGILRPMDYVHPYRLEMGTRLKVGRSNNLYEFWGDKLVHVINDELAQEKEQVLVNLASNEYFKALPKKKLKGKIITPVFKDFKNGEYKTIMVYAKKARGMMANYIIKNRIEKQAYLRGFDYDGYVFNEEASTDTELVFLRG